MSKCNKNKTCQNAIKIKHVKKFLNNNMCKQCDPIYGSKNTAQLLSLIKKFLVLPIKLCALKNS